MARPALALLSSDHLLHNVNFLKRKVFPSKIIAMVKANAYGHGLRSVALRLDCHVDMFGVASMDEALALRKAGVESPILLAEGVFEQSELLVACKEGFHVVFHESNQLQWLDDAYLPSPLNAWIKINTGMCRLGFTPERGLEVYKKMSNLSSIKNPVHILSHLACADETEHPLNATQIQRTEDFARSVQAIFGTQNIQIPLSLCNSAGIFHFPNHYHAYVRPGIALYGLSPIAGKTGQDLGLKPVMEAQSALIAIQTVAKGESVGYGAEYICKRPTSVGIVAFGYGDGYPFGIAGGTCALLHHETNSTAGLFTKCPLMGRVSMDMLALDITECPQATVGDRVTLWGDNLPLEQVIQHSGQIPYTVVTGIQNRVRSLWT